MEVFEPACLTATVFDPRMASYVEHSIPNRDLQAFVTQCPEDQKKLLHELNDNQKLYVNCVCDPGHDFPAPQLPDMCKQAGIEATVTDLFDAPAPVKRYLVHQVRRAKSKKKEKEKENEMVMMMMMMMIMKRRQKHT